MKLFRITIAMALNALLGLSLRVMTRIGLISLAYLFISSLSFMANGSTLVVERCLGAIAIILYTKVDESWGKRVFSPQQILSRN